MKYKLTDVKINFMGKTLFQIEAVKCFGDIVKGQKGGFIEKESNLSQGGDAWVSGNAKVYGNAEVSGDAWVSGNAKVSGDAWVSGNAKVYGNAEVYGDAWVSGNAKVYGNAEVSGNADYLVIGPIGSRNDITTFFKTANNDIKVSCGCFTGNIEEFLEKVNETHGNNNYAKEYKTAVEIAKIHIFGGE